MNDPTSQIAEIWQKVDLETLWANNSVHAWAQLLIVVAGGWLVGRVLAALLARFARRYAAHGRPGRAQVLLDLSGPMSLAFLTLGLAIGFDLLDSKPAYAEQTLTLLTNIAIFWFLFNLVGILGLVAKRLTRKSKSALDREVVPLVQRSLRVVLLMFAALTIGKSVFDWDIGALLAGLGIAGIAVSLAAQDSLKHLFGSLTLLLDRPFGIGDRIVSCGFEGTIEDVGFRSTKIRTPAGHLVTVPNSNIVNGPIENISRRPAIRRVVNLMIPIATPSETVRETLAALARIFDEEHIRGPVRPVIGGVERAPQVRLEDIQSDNLKVAITYWYAPANDPGQAAHTDRVNLRIVEVLEKTGVRAGPSPASPPTRT